MDNLNDFSLLLDEIYKEFEIKEEEPEILYSHSSPLEDQIIIEKLNRAKNKNLFQSLFYHGDCSRYNGDHSRADLALISLIAFYTQDSVQIQRIFEMSALSRGKWKDREDYRRRTIDQAIFKLTSTYKEKTQKQFSSEQFVITPLSELMNSVIPPETWYIEGILPTEGIIMVHAAAGVGKSFFCQYMAMCLSYGYPFFDFSVNKPSRVCYIDGEMSLASLKERFHKLGGCFPLEDGNPSLSLISSAQQKAPMDFSLPQFQIEFLKCLDQFDIIFFDNLSTLTSFEDENQSSQHFALQKFLLEIRKRGKSVVLVHHDNKSGGYRGSSMRDVILNVRIQLTGCMDEDSSDPCFYVRFLKVRGSRANLQPFQVKIKSFPTHFLLGKYSYKEGMLEEIQEMEQLGMSGADIQRELGISKKIYQKIKKGR